MDNSEMGDSETGDIIQLQTRIAERLRQLGFVETPHAGILAHQLAEVAARSRTLHEQALPLFLSLDQEYRRPLAEVTIALKSHLDAIQDSIVDVQSSLQTLIDFLVNRSEK